MAELLNYQEYGHENQKVIIILHGFLGSSKNWATIAKLLADKYHVYTLDLRNHGESFHAASHTYLDMVNDVKMFMDAFYLEDVQLLGHSMGGKVAMKFACEYPEYLANLMVVDIAPKKYTPHRNEVKGMLSIPLDKIQSRLEAENILSEYVADFGLRKFLMTNLIMDQNKKFSWRINLKGLSEQMPLIGNMCLSDEDVYEEVCHFIIGEQSDFVLAEDYPTIKKYFPMAQIHSILGSDHNPHFTCREAFMALLEKLLK